MKKVLSEKKTSQTSNHMNYKGTQATAKVANNLPQKKRRHRRVPIAASAAITFGNNENTASVPAVVSNISLSGVGIYVDYPLEKRATVHIRITFISENGRMKSDSMKGTIVHTNKIGSLYYAGIEFDEELNLEKQPFLSQYLHQLYMLDSLKTN